MCSNLELLNILKEMKVGQFSLHSECSGSKLLYSFNYSELRGTKRRHSEHSGHKCLTLYCVPLLWPGEKKPKNKSKRSTFVKTILSNR